MGWEIFLNFFATVSGVQRPDSKNKMKILNYFFYFTVPWLFKKGSRLGWVTTNQMSIALHNWQKLDLFKKPELQNLLYTKRVNNMKVTVVHLLNFSHPKKFLQCFLCNFKVNEFSTKLGTKFGPTVWFGSRFKFRNAIACSILTTSHHHILRTELGNSISEYIK